jgi:hypothetical protein
MKAVLKFDLPEERKEFEMASNALNWYSVVWEMDQYLRSKTKYAPDSMPDEVYKTFQETREKLHEILNQNNVHFD